MKKQYFVYIMSSRKNGTLYIGVTSNLVRRVFEHREKLVEGFTSRYDIRKLVYYESYFDVFYALKREKSLKVWQRKWKIRLIESMNPKWEDLYEQIL